MGYVLVTSPCVGCGRVFVSNPKYCPSIRVKWVNGSPVPDENGQREPVCRDCFEFRQEYRVAHGLERESLHPQAYEALDEDEL